MQLKTFLGNSSHVNSNISHNGRQFNAVKY